MSPNTDAQSRTSVAAHRAHRTAGRLPLQILRREPEPVLRKVGLPEIVRGDIRDEGRPRLLDLQSKKKQSVKLGPSITSNGSLACERAV
jgi:hypothetical protein